MSKRKAQPVVMRKAESNTLVIRAGKTAMGHQAHITGSGAHDNRPRRQRTRNAQRQAWKRDQS
jgi:hypothetical protein